MDKADWPGPVIALYLGRASPEQVLAATADKNQNRQRELECEAFFYVGQFHLLSGQRPKAAEFFRKAIETGLTDFIEYQSAKVELKRMN